MIKLQLFAEMEKSSSNDKILLHPVTLGLLNFLFAGLRFRPREKGKKSSCYGTAVVHWPLGQEAVSSKPLPFNHLCNVSFINSINNLAALGNMDA